MEKHIKSLTDLVGSLIDDNNKHKYDDRVQINGSHFAKCKGISSICKAFSQRNNKMQS